MKLRKSTLVVVLTLFVLLTGSSSANKSYENLVKEVPYPVPTKVELQMMLQGFVNTLYPSAFHEFSEKDFYHGHLLYRSTEKDNQLIAILYHTQELQTFDKNMRSWYQAYQLDKISKPSNAISLIRYDRYSFDGNKALRCCGTVYPAMLSEELAGVGYVQVNFYPTTIQSKDTIKLRLQGKTVTLTVSYSYD